MDNNKELQMDFCSKCGAMTKDGVCQNCGWGDSETVSAEQNPYEQNPYEQNLYEQQQFNVAVSLQQSDMLVQGQEQPRSYSGTDRDYVNHTAYTYGAIPPDVPVQKNNRKVWVIIGICAAIFLTLIILLCVAIGNLVSKISESSSEDFYSFNDDYDIYDDITERAKQNQGNSQSGEEDYVYEEEKEKTYGYSPEDDYYEYLHDSIKDDLSYTVTLQNEDYVAEDRDAYILAEYPVLEGDIPNIDYLNQYIYDEYLYFRDLCMENIEMYVGEQDSFFSMIDAYVTYMDEDVISIVYDKRREYRNYSWEASLCSINIDVKNGTIMNNVETLYIDQEFIDEFRIREAEQNDSDILSMYEDWELMELLLGPDSLILYYTPLGMEVGINHDYGWSTATYKDYKKYLMNF